MAEKISFKDSMKEIAKNKNYWVLFGAFTLMLGSFNTFGTIINQVLVPFGYDDTDTGIFGALYILSGLIGAACAGIYVENTLKYKFSLRIIGVGFWTTTIGLIGGLYSGKAWAMGILIFIAGLVQTPILPMGLDFSCEIGFPLGEAICSGILVTGGNVMGII